jgi:hypothetical protein
MARAMLLMIVLWSRPVRADECECEPVNARAEIAAGVGLFAVGYTMGILAQIAVPASPAEYVLVRPMPVFGAIEGAVRSGEDWGPRIALMFSAGVQVIGILLAGTAYAANRDELQPARRVSLRSGGLTVKF